MISYTQVLSLVHCYFNIKYLYVKEISTLYWLTLTEMLLIVLEFSFNYFIVLCVLVFY